LIRPENRPRLRTRKLAALAALASPAFALILVAYFHSTPNTAGVSFSGPFDGERAFADLRHIVAFGPRPPGSQALHRCRAFITGELHRAGVQVSEDAFTATTPIGSIPMTNIVATFPGTPSSVVIIGGHYDTKRTPTLFVSANDGGSSTAFLLELARVLARKKHALTYRLVFFDGEEALKCWSANDSLYGSRHFAAKLARQGTLAQIRAVIVVDMIADAQLDIHRDLNSTPWLNAIVFGQAHDLGYGRYFLNSTRRIEDDHLPFRERGIPAVDIIDLDYGPLNLYWHTRLDTLDKCRPGSLQVVGQVVQNTLEVLEAVGSTVGR